MLLLVELVEILAEDEDDELNEVVGAGGGLELVSPSFCWEERSASLVQCDGSAELSIRPSINRL